MRRPGLRESVASWWDDLDGSQKHAVQRVQAAYGFDRREVREAIESGLLRWKRVRDAPKGWSADRQSYTPGRYWWCLVES